MYLELRSNFTVTCKKYKSETMKTIIPVVFSLIIQLFGPNQLIAQNFVWAKASIGTYSVGNDIFVDNAGNVYNTGYFRGTVDFDPGPGTYNLTSNGNDDIFVQKLDVNGNLLWARKFGGIGDDYGISIGVDWSGNVYTFGHYQNTVDFDPGPGIQNHTSYGYFDMFIHKLDVAGNFVWAKVIGGTSGDGAASINVSGSGNLTLTGSFSGTVDFDPGINYFYMHSTLSDNSDAFVLRLNSSGDFIFAKGMGGTGYDGGGSITVDGWGHIYSAGTYNENGDFDPGPGLFALPLTNYYNGYISKLDALGNFIWAKALESDGGFIQLSSIKVDKFGDIVVTGSFGGTVDFDPGVATYNLSSSLNDLFVLKLNEDGDLVWVEQIGSNGFADSRSMWIDADENIYITGNFSGTVDFDPGIGTFNQSSATVGSPDIFALKLDALGLFVWAIRIGGTTYDVGLGITGKGFDDIYFTGYFSGTVDFNPNAGLYTLSSGGGGNLNMFVTKLNQPSTRINEWDKDLQVIAVPNPTTGIVYLTFDPIVNDVNVIVSNITGNEISDNKYKNLEQLQLELPDTKGIYFITVENVRFTKTIRIVKE